MKYLKYLLPYFLISEKRLLKRLFKGMIPYGIVILLKSRQRKRRFSTVFLRNNCVSDLTLPERYTILSFLKFLEKTQRSVNYLEIGVYAGGTIKFLNDHTHATQFTGIDLFEDFKPSNENTHMWQNYSLHQVQEALADTNIELVKGDSMFVLANMVGRKFDFIFIDGNHTYEATRVDFENAKPLLTANGFIAFHNASPGLTPEDRSYIASDGGPWLFTQELLGDASFRLIESMDRLRVFQWVP